MSRTTIATDNFSTYADGHLQAVSGGNWTDTDAGYNGWMTVTSHTVLANSGPLSDAYWAGSGSFTADQGASIQIATLGLGNDHLGVVARCNTNAQPLNNCYRAYIYCFAGGGQIILNLTKVVAGTETSLGTDTTQAASWTAGDTIEIDCQGTTIRALRNGSSVITVTDSDLSTGKPGVCAAVSASATTGGTWTGFNVGAAAGTPFWMWDASGGGMVSMGGGMCG